MFKWSAGAEKAITVSRLGYALNPAHGRQPVSTMARIACLSRRHFHRLTVQAFGESPAARQRRIRLDCGAWRLMTSQASILAIALETGWESHEVFTRAFRARFGMSPSKFRESRGRALPMSIRAGFAIALKSVDAKEK